MSIRTASRCIAVTVLIACASVWANAEAATLTFYNGIIADVGTDTNCITLTSEIREQAYAGFSERNLRIPAPGEIWYAHVVISHPGDPCSGGSETDIEISLPPSTAFAISTDNPVFCAFRTAAGAVTVYYRQDQGCPQAPTAGGEQGYYDFPAYNGSSAQPWPIAWQTFFELMIPLHTSAILNGSNTTFRINPDIGVVGYAAVGTYVSSDTIFRDDMENDAIVPDICTISGTTSCSLAP